MTIDPSAYECPGCHGPIRIEDRAAREVECPNCGNRWAPRPLDVPGNRFLLRLTPPGA